MNTKPLIIKNDINNNQQYCKGCEKNLPSDLFITNGKPYCTCNICCIQNKVIYQWKLQQMNANTDQIVIDFYDFSDFLSNAFENVANSEENKEDLNFIFSCTINITALEGDPKKKLVIL